MSQIYRCYQYEGHVCSCTPDRNCHTFCLGDKIASHPGVLTQAKKNTQNLEINQILGVVVQEKESNMVFCSRWKFPTQGMTVLSGTSADRTPYKILIFLLVKCSYSFRSKSMMKIFLLNGIEYLSTKRLINCIYMKFFLHVG